MTSIQIIHIKYLIKFFFLPLTSLSLYLAQISCKPPVGHNHPHQNLPRNSDPINIYIKETKDPEIIPTDIASIIIYGEK